MTVTTLQSAQVIPSGTGSYLLKIVLSPAQTGPWAALTRKLPGLPSPRDQLAIIIDGRVIADPAVQGPITDGTAELPGFATRAQAESLLSSLRNSNATTPARIRRARAPRGPATDPCWPILVLEDTHPKRT